ncbi:hypothetical protein Tco_1369270 [Tanacetum coccineum]
MLEEVRPVIETLAYNDKYKKLLDEIWVDKVRLDGKIKPEEEIAMVKVKGQMLKEKKDPEAFLFPIRLEGLINENDLIDTGSDTNTMPYRIYEQLGKDDIMQEERNITMINYTEAEVTSRLVNVLCQVGFTTLILTTFDGLTRQTFRAARSEKIRIAESDSDDEEDYVIKRNDMGTPIHNSGLIGYQNNTNPAENITLSTLESTGSSRAKRSRNVETVEEALLPDVHDEFLEWSGCSREAKSRYNTRLTTFLPKLIYSPQIVDWQLLHKIGCGEEIDNMLKISLKEAETGEEIFFSVAWVRAFNICEPIYLELYHEFYDTYEFDEEIGIERISADRDLHLSRSLITFVRFPILRVLHKMITYRLCQRTTGYEKIQRNDLWLLSMFEARHQNGYANVAWVIAKWIKRKGVGSQKVSQICYGQIISKIARKSRVLTEEIVRTLSTPVYYRDLDRTTLRELIDSEDRLIPDIPVDDVPRVAA